MRALARTLNSGWQRYAVVVALALTCTAVRADPTTYSGSLSDPTNPALMGSGPEPSMPSFDNPSDTANNVAVYDLDVPFGGFTDFDFGGFSDITFSDLFSAAADSPSYGTTGLMPYLSLFRGTGPRAVYLTSSFQDANSFDGNVDLHVYLTAGNYVFTISNLTNQSTAQLRQGGTLGEGFSGRGDPAYLGDASYRLTVTTPSSIPEPDSVWLAALGAALLVVRRRRKSAVTASRDAGVEAG